MGINIGILVWLAAVIIIATEPFLMSYLDLRKHIKDTRLKRWQYWLNLAMFMLACYSMAFVIVLVPFSYFWLVPSIMALLAWEWFSLYSIYPAAKKKYKEYREKWGTPSWEGLYVLASLTIPGVLALLAIVIGHR